MDTINKIIKSDFLNNIMNYIIDNMWILGIVLIILVIVLLIVLFSKKKRKNENGTIQEDNVGSEMVITNFPQVDNNTQNISLDVNSNVESSSYETLDIPTTEEENNNIVLDNTFDNLDESINNEPIMDVPEVNESAVESIDIPQTLEYGDILKEEAKELESTLELPKMVNDVVNEGIEAKKVCQNCNEENPYHYKVCAKCGSLLE